MGDEGRSINLNNNADVNKIDNSNLIFHQKSSQIKNNIDFCAGGYTCATLQSNNLTGDKDKNLHQLTSSINSIESSLTQSLYWNTPLPEIELVSLSNQVLPVPRYRLRVDPCTAFVGYKHKDFIGAKRLTKKFPVNYKIPHSPTELTTIEDNCSGHSLNESPEVLSEEEDGLYNLTAEQIEKTLEYFMLCGLRVSQMTKTYEDLDAITQLLEEKQTDLEVAAKIGKNLLDRNRDLENKLAEFEKLSTTHEDTISQLRHELTIKDGLLQILCKDTDQLDEFSVDTNRSDTGAYLSSIKTQQTPSDGFPLSSIDFSQLNRKLRDLEEENILLRQERNRLCKTADELDEQENALIRDCARQLVTANMHIRTLSEELAKKSELFMNQQCEITRLITRDLDLENRIKQLVTENEMLSNRLNEMQISQSLITNELKNVRDKYDECLTLYNEAKNEVRALRKRSRRAYFRPSTNSTPIDSVGLFLHSNSLDQHDSYVNQSVVLSEDDSTSSLDVFTNRTALAEHTLASDLAQTALKDYKADNVGRLIRVMDQARLTRNQMKDLYAGGSSVDDAISTSGFVSGSEPSENTRRQANRGNPSQSSPTIIADNKLDSSLMSMRQMLYSATPLDSSEKRHSWLDYDDARSNRILSTTKNFRTSVDDSVITEPIRSSDPLFVYGQSFLKFPQRLQLIKPLDGSTVLQHWQQLATPSFTRALFEAPLPGVQSRAGVSNQTETKLNQSIKKSLLNSPRSLTITTASPTRVNQIMSLESPDNFLTNKPNHRKSIDQSSVDRFGFNLPSLLLREQLRTHSLDHLIQTTRDHEDISMRSHRPSYSTSANANCVSSAFSITSLVSALLPFSLKKPTSHGQNDISKTSKLYRSNDIIRGLLDVSKEDSSSKSIHRTMDAVNTLSSAPVLPNPPPPPIVSRSSTVYSRTVVRGSNLSEITEEVNNISSTIESQNDLPSIDNCDQTLCS